MSNLKIITKGELKSILNAVMCAEDTILNLETYPDMEQMLSDAIEILAALQNSPDTDIPDGDQYV